MCAGVVTETSLSIPQCSTFESCQAMATDMAMQGLLFPYSYVALDNMMGIYDDALVSRYRYMSTAQFSTPTMDTSADCLCM